MFHRIILAAASVVALTAAANAADMYRPAEGGYKDTPFVGVNWSGLYFGANGGYGWTDTSGLKPEGGFGGGQVGYNIQRDKIVFGLETDIQGAGITDRKSGDKSEMDWFGTVRGRVGYTIDKALVYGTGGFAYGNVKNTAPGVSHEATQTGWVAGGGVEYKINPSWSAKAEYQYIDLDANDSAGGLGSGRNSDSSKVNTFRVGVNYFVGSTFEPLK